MTFGQIQSFNVLVEMRSLGLNVELQNTRIEPEQFAQLPDAAGETKRARRPLPGASEMPVPDLASD